MPPPPSLPIPSGRPLSPRGGVVLVHAVEPTGSTYNDNNRYSSNSNIPLSSSSRGPTDRHQSFYRGYNQDRFGPSSHLNQHENDQYNAVGSGGQLGLRTFVTTTVSPQNNSTNNGRNGGVHISQSATNRLSASPPRVSDAVLARVGGGASPTRRGTSSSPIRSTSSRQPPSIRPTSSPRFSDTNNSNYNNGVVKASISSARRGGGEMDNEALVRSHRGEGMNSIDIMVAPYAPPPTNPNQRSYGGAATPAARASYSLHRDISPNSSTMRVSVPPLSRPHSPTHAGESRRETPLNRRNFTNATEPALAPVNAPDGSRKASPPRNFSPPPRSRPRALSTVSSSPAVDSSRPSAPEATVTVEDHHRHPSRPFDNNNNNYKLNQKMPFTPSTAEERKDGEEIGSQVRQHINIDTAAHHHNPRDMYSETNQSTTAAAAHLAARPLPMMVADRLSYLRANQRERALSEHRGRSAAAHGDTVPPLPHTSKGLDTTGRGSGRSTIESTSFDAAPRQASSKMASVSHQTENIQKTSDANSQHHVKEKESAFSDRSLSAREQAEALLRSISSYSRHQEEGEERGGLGGIDEVSRPHLNNEQQTDNVTSRGRSEQPQQPHLVTNIARNSPLRIPQRALDAARRRAEEVERQGVRQTHARPRSPHEAQRQLSLVMEDEGRLRDPHHALLNSATSSVVARGNRDSTRERFHAGEQPRAQLSTASRQNEQQQVESNGSSASFAAAEEEYARLIKTSSSVQPPNIPPHFTAVNNALNDTNGNSYMRQRHHASSVNLQNDLQQGTVVETVSSTYFTYRSGTVAPNGFVNKPQQSGSRRNQQGDGLNLERESDEPPTPANTPAWGVEPPTPANTPTALAPTTTNTPITENISKIDRQQQHTTVTPANTPVYGPTPVTPANTPAWGVEPPTPANTPTALAPGTPANTPTSNGMLPESSIRQRDLKEVSITPANTPAYGPAPVTPANTPAWGVEPPTPANTPTALAPTTPTNTPTTGHIFEAQRSSARQHNNTVTPANTPAYGPTPATPANTPAWGVEPPTPANTPTALVPITPANTPTGEQIRHVNSLDQRRGLDQQYFAGGTVTPANTPAHGPTPVTPANTPAWGVEPPTPANSSARAATPANTPVHIHSRGVIHSASGEDRLRSAITAVRNWDDGMPRRKIDEAAEGQPSEKERQYPPTPAATPTNLMHHHQQRDHSSVRHNYAQERTVGIGVSSGIATGHYTDHVTHGHSDDDSHSALTFEFSKPPSPTTYLQRQLDVLAGRNSRGSLSIGSYSHSQSHQTTTQSAAAHDSTALHKPAPLPPSAAVLVTKKTRRKDPENHNFVTENSPNEAPSPPPRGAPVVPQVGAPKSNKQTEGNTAEVGRAHNTYESSSAGKATKDEAKEFGLGVSSVVTEADEDEIDDSPFSDIGASSSAAVVSNPSWLRVDSINTHKPTANLGSSGRLISTSTTPSDLHRNISEISPPPRSSAIPKHYATSSNSAQLSGGAVDDSVIASSNSNRPHHQSLTGQGRRRATVSKAALAAVNALASANAKATAVRYFSRWWRFVAMRAAATATSAYSRAHHSQNNDDNNSGGGGFESSDVLGQPRSFSRPLQAPLDWNYTYAARGGATMAMPSILGLTATAEENNRVGDSGGSSSVPPRNVTKTAHPSPNERETRQHQQQAAAISDRNSAKAKVEEEESAASGAADAQKKTNFAIINAVAYSTASDYLAARRAQRLLSSSSPSPFRDSNAVMSRTNSSIAAATRRYLDRSSASPNYSPPSHSHNTGDVADERYNTANNSHYTGARKRLPVDEELNFVRSVAVASVQRTIESSANTTHANNLIDYKSTTKPNRGSSAASLGHIGPSSREHITNEWNSLINDEISAVAMLRSREAQERIEHAWRSGAGVSGHLEAVDRLINASPPRADASASRSPTLFRGDLSGRDLAEDMRRKARAKALQQMSGHVESPIR